MVMVLLVLVLLLCFVVVCVIDGIGRVVICAVVITRYIVAVVFTVSVSSSTADGGIWCLWCSCCYCCRR